MLYSVYLAIINCTFIIYSTIDNTVKKRSVY